MESARLSATAGLSRSPAVDASQVLQDRILSRAQPISAPLSLPLQRVAGIDLLRIIAAVGIIWFHTDGAPYAQIGYAGLPAFLLIYFSLVTKQSQAHATREFLRRRWARLLKPWLFWSIVYGTCRVIKAAYTGDFSSLEHMLFVGTLFIGTSIHLWYLPYAFLSGLLIYLLNRRI
jgi:peptidoglycan/LPS O-acetylase OafA/YrhL